MKIKFLKESKDKRSKKRKAPQDQAVLGVYDHEMQTPEQLRGEEPSPQDYKKLYYDLLEIMSDSREARDQKNKNLKKKIQKQFRDQKEKYEELIKSEYVKKSEIMTGKIFFTFVREYMIQKLNANKIVFKANRDKNTGSIDFNYDISYN